MNRIPRERESLGESYHASLLVSYQYHTASAKPASSVPRSHVSGSQPLTQDSAGGQLSHTCSSLTHVHYRPRCLQLYAAPPSPRAHQRSLHAGRHACVMRTRAPALKSQRLKPRTQPQLGSSRTASASQPCSAPVLLGQGHARHEATTSRHDIGCASRHTLRSIGIGGVRHACTHASPACI